MLYSGFRWLEPFLESCRTSKLCSCVVYKYWYEVRRIQLDDVMDTTRYFRKTSSDRSATVENEINQRIEGVLSGRMCWRFPFLNVFHSEGSIFS